MGCHFFLSGAGVVVRPSAELAAKTGVAAVATDVAVGSGVA